jgi:hypothetical protein
LGLLFPIYGKYNPNVPKHQWKTGDIFKLAIPDGSKHQKWSYHNKNIVLWWFSGFNTSVIGIDEKYWDIPWNFGFQCGIWPLPIEYLIPITVMIIIGLEYWDNHNDHIIVPSYLNMIIRSHCHYPNVLVKHIIIIMIPSW